MISHYTAIVWIMVFAMGIMIVTVKGNPFMPVKSKNGFMLLFAFLIIVNLAEWFAASINGKSVELRSLQIASKFIEFLFTPLVSAVCVSALGGNKIMRKLFGVLIGLNLLLQITSLFTGVVFTVDAGNVYHRSSLYIIYVLIFVSSILLLLVHCVQFSKRYQSQNTVFLSLIMLLVVLAMLSQMVFSYLRLDWVCVSIASIMFYLYYDQLVQQVDTLTALLNRRSYDCQTQQLKEPSDVLFFDVDHFKDANDTYGHRYGDECLRRLAGEVKRVFGKYGYCYRFGGDEFCVIKPHGTADTQALIAAYLNGIGALRRQDPNLPQVSIGFATYHPAEEPIEDAVARADAMMYQYKELHHQQNQPPESPGGEA